MSRLESSRHSPIHHGSESDRRSCWQRGEIVEVQREGEGQICMLCSLSRLSQNIFLQLELDLFEILSSIRQGQGRLCSGPVTEEKRLGIDQDYQKHQV